MDNETIGRLLAEARTSRNFTQADMCEATNLTKNHISYMERGQGKATVKMLLGYCNKLGMTPNEILQYEKKEAGSMETKTHIYIANKIVKLAKYDTIMIYPNGTIEGYQDFDGHEEAETLFRGTQEEAEKVMQSIKDVLCI